MSRNNQLRQLVARGKPIIAPGAFDGLSARLVEQAGFDAIYASGGAIARSTGRPDLGLLSLTEVVDRMAQIVEVTNIPVIADADTGFGNALNVARAVKMFERAGVSAIHMEDQSFPKRCGHLDQKTLISAEEMLFKIQVAKEAIADPEVMLIARTDAIAVEGFDVAIERAKQYIQAGVDMIFVEAPQTVEQIEKIAAEIKTPKLINMFYGGKTPLVPMDRLAELGFNCVIIPSDLQRAGIFAMQKTLAAIKKVGDSKALADELVSFQDREKIIGTEDYLELDRQFKD